MPNPGYLANKSLDRIIRGEWAPDTAARQYNYEDGSALVYCSSLGWLVQFPGQSRAVKP
jgi:hypothetical protein